jgi:uncharacterized protein YecT (DUF1311 family)
MRLLILIWIIAVASTLPAALLAHAQTSNTQSSQGQGGVNAQGTTNIYNYYGAPSQPMPSRQPSTTVLKPGWCQSQASFNKSEVLVCHDEELSRLDRRLQALHDKLLSTMPAAQRKKFDSNNDAWSDRRDACNGERGCVMQTYQRRLVELERM